MNTDGARQACPVGREQYGRVEPDLDGRRRRLGRGVASGKRAENSQREEYGSKHQPPPMENAQIVEEGARGDRGGHRRGVPHALAEDMLLMLPLVSPE